MEKYTGIVLAGGKSSRMGCDKAPLPWGTSDMLNTILNILAKFCEQIIVVSNSTRNIFLPGVTIVEDIYKNCGPLGGMHVGLITAKYKYSFITACDMPYLNSAAALYCCRIARGYDAAVPFIDNYYHPLHAVYNRSCIRFIETLLLKNSFQILGFYDKIYMRKISSNELLKFDKIMATLNNINTREDLKINIKGRIKK